MMLACILAVTVSKTSALVRCVAPLGLWCLQLKPDGNTEISSFADQDHLHGGQLLLICSFSSFSSIWWDLVSPVLPRTS